MLRSMAVAISVFTRSGTGKVIEVQRFELALAGEFERCIGMDAWLESYDAIAEPYRREFLTANAAVIADIGAVELTG